jgi:pyrimidine-nucleoside phosphorylase
VGNSLEVIEAIETLHGRGPADFRQHCVDVAAEMLLIATEDPQGLEDPSTGSGQALEGLARKMRTRAAATLDNGSAWAKFRQWIAAQGGDPSTGSGQTLAAVDDPTRLPRAPIIRPLAAPRGGYVAAVDAREVGFTVVDLGGGRARKDDPVDPAVGVVLAERGKIGGKVAAGEPLLWVHARDEAASAAALARLAAAYTFSDAPVAAPPVVHRVIR